jgi:hypothetical protein
MWKELQICYKYMLTLFFPTIEYYNCFFLISTNCLIFIKVSQNTTKQQKAESI